MDESRRTHVNEGEFCELHSCDCKLTDRKLLNLGRLIIVFFGQLTAGGRLKRSAQPTARGGSELTTDAVKAQQTNKQHFTLCLIDEALLDEYKATGIPFCGIAVFSSVVSLCRLFIRYPIVR